MKESVIAFNRLKYKTHNEIGNRDDHMITSRHLAVSRGQLSHRVIGKGTTPS